MHKVKLVLYRYFPENLKLEKGIVLYSGKYSRFLNSAATNKIKPLGKKDCWKIL